MMTNIKDVFLIKKDETKSVDRNWLFDNEKKIEKPFKVLVLFEDEFVLYPLLFREGLKLQKPKIGTPFTNYVIKYQFNTEWFAYDYTKETTNFKYLFSAQTINEGITFYDDYLFNRYRISCLENAFGVKF